ncbi:fimbrial protein [Dyella mobilis]|uniref:Type 1 fimbrial protein n=1 Tax=Dyella mobilis TaxID=1849582 RepID=A0ABS2KCE5_9GAMM|nr:type 1 fimbrial protein [Dyella mobilis]MBM7128599.1 type 1 fimbrial protein [Dyella mobilis]GLQ99497.1 ferrous iron transporter B [Dyella mobilis]
MKKTIITAALLAAFGVAAVAPQAATAATTSSSGTLTINGLVTGSTCSVAINGGTANATITLPTVATSELSAAGNTAGWTAVTFAFSGCTLTGNNSTGTAITSVLPYFQQGATTASDGNLTNATGSAGNVEVAFSNTNSGATASLVKMNQPVGSQNVTAATVTGGAATEKLYAGYYATGASTAGTVATTVQYDIAYQ